MTTKSIKRLTEDLYDIQLVFGKHSCSAPSYIHSSAAELMSRLSCATRLGGLPCHSSPFRITFVIHPHMIEIYTKYPVEFLRTSREPITGKSTASPSIAVAQRDI